MKKKKKKLCVKNVSKDDYLKEFWNELCLKSKSPS